MKFAQKHLSLAIINATSFYDAGLAIKDTVKEGDPNVVKMFLIEVPATVNFCFAAELYLKVFISKFGLDFEKTHKLRNLFDALPLCLQSVVQVYYGRISGADPQSFMKNLDSVSNSFEKLRYFATSAFQDNHISVPFMFAYHFATALKELTMSFNKETAKLIESFKRG